MKTVFKEGFRDLEMRGIRRRDSHQINPILARAFARQHLFPVAIGTVCGDPQTLRISAPGIWVMVQSPCNH